MFIKGKLTSQFLTLITGYYVIILRNRVRVKPMSPVLFSGHVYTVKLCFIGLETFSRNKVSHRIVPSYIT